MNFKPLADRILIKRLESEETTKGGIVIPDTAKEKPMRGEIMAVGPGKTSDKGVIMPLEVKIGQAVLFGKYAGTEIKVDGIDYLVMREDDVIAIVES